MTAAVFASPNTHLTLLGVNVKNASQRSARQGR